MLLEEPHALGIAFISPSEGIDATTPAGNLQMHILGAIAEFERSRMAERVQAGLQRAKTHRARLGRPQAQIKPRTSSLGSDGMGHSANLLEWLQQLR